MFTTKIPKPMISPDNPDNINNHCSDSIKFLYFCLSLLIFVLVYFGGLGLAYGIIIFNKPGYNLTTGCPIHIPNCPEQCNYSSVYVPCHDCNDSSGRVPCRDIEKMMCYDGHLDPCFILALLTMWLIPSAILPIIALVMGCWVIVSYLFKTCINNMEITNDVFKRNKILIKILLILFIIILLYLGGVGLTYGFMIVSEPGYNLTTGCPNHAPNCPDVKKLLCYDGHLYPCFIWGLLTMWLIPLVFIPISGIGMMCRNICIDCIDEFKDEFKTPDNIVTAHGNLFELTIQEEIRCTTKERSAYIILDHSDADSELFN